MPRLSRAPGVPLENDEQIAFVQWCRANQIRGCDWRVANIGVPIDRYLINEYGDMVSTEFRNEPFHLMKRQNYKEGYQYYSLGINGNKAFKIKVHRAVALTFIPNPRGCPMVNHKNGVKNDNRVDNLEWVTASENLLHAYKKLGLKSNGGVARKRVQCVETGVIFPSVRAAARSIGPTISNTSLSAAASGKIKKCKGSTFRVITCGGFHWRFV